MKLTLTTGLQLNCEVDVDVSPHGQVTIISLEAIVDEPDDPAVHPADKRPAHLQHRRVQIPLALLDARDVAAIEDSAIWEAEVDTRPQATMGELQGLDTFHG